MAKVLSQIDSNKAIEEIVMRARHFVVLISPFCDFEFLYNILSRRKPNVNVTIHTYLPDKPFENKSSEESYQNKLKEYERQWFYFEKLKLLHNVDSSYIRYRNDRLPFDYCFHSKCYFNECRFLISSMNLSWSANNDKVKHLETSVLLYKNKDRQAYFEAIDWYCDVFMKSIYNINSLTYNQLFIPFNCGHCIHCGQTMYYDKEKPYCRKDYSLWNKDPYCIEFYCHKCGKQFDYERSTITFKMPICPECMGQEKGTITLT